MVRSYRIFQIFEFYSPFFTYSSVINYKNKNHKKQKVDCWLGDLAKTKIKTRKDAPIQTK
jgi:hypothetical protein